MNNSLASQAPTGRALAGKRVLVTGASSGIGWATARLLLDRGATVIAAGRRAERLQQLDTDVGTRLTAMAGNINDAAFRRALVEACDVTDGLVNAAGVLQHAPFLESDPAAWESMWQTNVHSLLCLTQAVARGMVSSGKGHIVNISSILAARVYPYTLAYAATKFAVRAISQGLRIELQAHGIKVTEVAPGLVQTEILRDNSHPDVISSYKSRPYLPLQPEHVARAIVDALAAPDNVCLDLIEVNPAGQA